MTTVAIIGGGAAGCFAAAHLSRMAPGLAVDLYESSSKLLAKVAVTGGGRCNLTNTFDCITDLSEAYPRGARLMKRALKSFSQADTCSWFESEGVRLTVQDGQYVFPASQDAMQIVRTLENALSAGGVRVHTGRKLTGIGDEDGLFSLLFADGKEAVADRVLVAVGGKKDFSFLDPLGLEIVPPCPSLFTFNLSDKAFRSLMGTVVEDAGTYIPGTKFRARGPLLITDWGVSGPAVLKLSSYAARYLCEKNWRSQLGVRWLPSVNESALRLRLETMALENPRRKISNVHPPELPSRLWAFLLSRSGLREDMVWAELGVKGLSRLVGTLLSDVYEITGRGSFKDEFVTAGGVSLSEVNPSDMRCRKHPGLYFAGEVLDVDAITGGFNLQAAWSTAFVAASSIAESL